MANKGKFITGFGLGIAAGIAAKLIYDNKDNLSELCTGARDEVNSFVDHASEKAGEYTKYATEQFSDLKTKVKETSANIIKKADQIENEIEKKY